MSLAEESKAPRYVKKRFIDTDRLHERRIGFEDGEEFLRTFANSLAVDRSDDRLWTKSLRHRHRLSRSAAEYARFVRCCRHHAALTVAADQHRLAADGGFIELGDGCEERIEIGVKNRSQQAHRSLNHCSFGYFFKRNDKQWF